MRVLDPPPPQALRACACRSWYLLLVAAGTFNRVLDWPGNAYPFLIREYHWSGMQLAGQFALWYALAVPSALLGGALVDAVGGARTLLIFQTLQFIGAVLLLAGPSWAVLYTSRVLAAPGYAVADLAMTALLVRAFGAAGARSGGADGGGGSGGDGGRTGCPRLVANLRACCDLRTFPQLSFSLAFYQASFLRISMIAGLLLSPLSLGAFGWIGIFYVPLFGAVALAGSAGVFIVEEGAVPCCAMSTWRNVGVRGGDSGEGDDGDSGDSGDGGDTKLLLAAGNGSAGVVRAGLGGSSGGSEVSALPPPPLPPPPPPPPPALCARVWQCPLELREAKVWVNGVAYVLAVVMYLPFSTQFAGALYAETYGLDDAGANLLVVWVKLALGVALIPVSLLLDARVLNYHATFIAGTATMATAWALIAARAAVPPALPAVAAGLGYACALAASIPLLSMRAHAASRGRVIGFFFALYYGGMFAASLVIGALRDYAPSPASTANAAAGAGAGAIGAGLSASQTAMYFLCAGEAAATACAVGLAALDGCAEPTRVFIGENEPKTK